MIIINQLYTFIKSDKWLVLIYFIATILESVFTLLSVYVLVPVIQFMFLQESNEVNVQLSYYFDALSFFNIDFTLINSLLIFLLMTILSSIASIFFYYISRVNGYAIALMLRSWALYKFYGQGLTFINSYSFGIIQNTFTKEIDSISDAIYSVLNLISVTIFMLMMFSFSMQLSQSMTLIIIVSYIFVGILMSIIGKKISSLSAVTLDTANINSNRLFNPILNAKNVLAFARKKWAFKIHTDAFKEHAQAAVKSQTLTFTLPELFKTSSVIIAVFALFYVLSQGEQLTLLIATLAIFIRMQGKLTVFTAAYANIRNAWPSVLQYNKLFPKNKIHNEKKQGKKIQDLHSSIELKNVSFSYSDRANVLSNVNLSIKKHSFVTLIGHSGSGKSTCADIIMGLYTPNSGKILIDGVSLDEIDLTSYLDLVGYVQQDNILLEGSVKDNLIWANPKASIDDMWESLRLVSIDSFISSLPEGLDTMVGDRGVTLSGGQRQRIALALALVRKPKILILDEVTSALDQESENIIRKSLESLVNKLTIILVTHRPSLAKHSDITYVFENGFIAESGNYIELLKNKKAQLNKIDEDL